MSTREYDAQGRLTRWDDDVARLVHRYDAQGVEILPATPYTPLQNARADAEAEAERQETNEATLRDRARAALANNITYLGISAPTNAQNTAQIKALTKQVNALIKLEVRDLSNLNGTA